MGKNGKFPDQEECDLYYDCKDDIAEAVYCKNGLVFDISRPNREKCDYPHKVDCSERPKTQPAPPGLDPKCQRENGYFDVEGDCTNYYNCDNNCQDIFFIYLYKFMYIHVLISLNDLSSLFAI